MEKKMYKLTTVVFLAMFLLSVTVTAHASPGSQALVAEGRALLFNNGDPTYSGLLTAKAKFGAAVQADATDQEANLFFAVTRLPALLDDTVSYTSGPPIENIKELLDGFGVSAQGRDIFDWTADFQRNSVYQYHLTVSGASNGIIEFIKEFDSSTSYELWYEYFSVWGASGICAILPYATHSPPLKYSPVTVGQSWKDAGDSNGYQVDSVSTVLSLNETVTVPAGTFTNCAKVEEILTHPFGYTPGQDYYTKFERWFAPGIGPCKVRMTYNSGTVSVGELTSYENIPSSSDYFPLELNSSWTFQLDGGDVTNWVVDSVQLLEGIGDIILPVAAPTSGEVITFLSDVLLFEINEALNNLSHIDSTFGIWLTAAETGNEHDIEVDYGDVLLYKSLLQAAKAAILLLSSYDLDVDIDEIIGKMNSDLFNINTDLLDTYPDFLKLLADGGTTIGDAREALLAAIDSYDAASTFIRQETDDQWDDLIALDPEDEAEDMEFRTILEKIKDSLENRRPVEIGDNLTRVDFSEFFDDPISIRHYLPTFNYDPYTGEYKGVSSFPDKTFSGILPDGLPPGIDFASINGYHVTSDLWIKAVINTEEKGPIEAVWQKGGEDTTSRGDRVIWGHFYASPNDVTWGSENNPDLFVKIWFDVSGRVDVNFFHVSVPDIEVYSDYPYDGTVDEYGTTTMSRRYIRQYYENGESNMDENYEDGNPPAGYLPTENPSGYSTINDLRIGGIINTVEKGPIDALWRLGGQDTTARGDQVVWGLFYASPFDVTWGSENNPDLFVKIWFDVSGRTDVNFFHVSVPDIEVYSALPDDGSYDQQGTTIMDNRYIRHEYWR